TQANVNISENTFEATGDAADVLMGGSEEDIFTAILVPQSYDGGQDFISVVANGKEYTATLKSNTTLTSGKQYYIYVTIDNDDISFTTLINEWGEGDLYEDQGESLMLSDITAESYPEDDVWVISDVEATSDDFLGLKDALFSVASSERTISLEFPYLTSFPEAALCDNISWNSITSLVSVSAPNAVELGENAFYRCTGLVTVDMPNVVTVGRYGFGSCSSLTEISLPEAVTLIEATFYSCSLLATFDLPKVQEAGNYAFYGCKPTSFSLPELRTLGASAFYMCTTLKSIDLPEIRTIGSSAFLYCMYLNSISLPKVESIGENAFYYCAISSAELPELTTLGNYAFIMCSSLQTVIAPKLVTVGNAVFSSCTSLATLEIATEPGCVFESVGSQVFMNATTSNITLTVGSDNAQYVDSEYFTPPTTSEEGEVYGPFKEVYLKNADGSLELVEDGVYLGDIDPKNISLYQLSAQNYPTDVNVWVIVDEQAATTDFTGLNGALRAAELNGQMVELSFPNLKEIPSYALYISSEAINSVKSFSAPEVISVGEYAFGYCSALSSLELPKLETTGYYAFGHCTSLESVSFPELVDVGSRTFWSCEGLISINLPKAATIGDSAFATNTSLVNLELPSATTIADWAFWNCTLLESIKLPSVTSICNYTFYDCTSLTSVEIATNTGVSVTSFGYHMFQNTNFENITFATSSTSGILAVDSSVKVPSTLDSEYGYVFCGPFKAVTVDGSTSQSTWNVIDGADYYESLIFKSWGLSALLIENPIVEEHSEVSGLFRMVQPYYSDAVIQHVWGGDFTAADAYSDGRLLVDNNFYIDATNPEKVFVPLQSTGFMVNTSYGFDYLASRNICNGWEAYDNWGTYDKDSGIIRFSTMAHTYLSATFAYVVNEDNAAGLYLKGYSGVGVNSQAAQSVTLPRNGATHSSYGKITQPKIETPTEM
ncbi:MAG: leucine-rich repeat protein, partial [Rikenellaceae bacterium]